jgi:4-amino-4-deoxy-L-arabinose transferase-like glycosyltransferase
MISSKRPDYNWLILLFVGLKIVLNLFAMPHFGFHCDELLHLALADHLDWGYKEVPPFIAVLAYLSIKLFGTSVFAARVFTTLCSGLIIWLTGQITVELGGRKFAITLACLSIIFAPAFAASGYLFQPVVFDQFWWVLAVWLLVKYINTQSVTFLYLLGAAVGFGMLTKYSMAFFTFALLFAVLISKQRKILYTKHLFGAVLVATLIFLPNIIWQYTHHFPFITHMKTLERLQLNYNKPADFITQQFLDNGIALFVWLLGFFFLLFSFRLRKFQFIAFAYVLIFLFLIVMKGKAYYLFGAYPMLFAAGGFAFERMLKSSRPVLRTAMVLLFTIPNLLLFPIVLPVLTINQTLAWFKFSSNLHFMDFTVTWEDQKKHATTQDYADMFGWEEMAQKAAKAYHSLTPEQQKQTIIFGGNYGEAGALHHYAKQYGLPDVLSLNSSFTLWAPDKIQMKYLIYIDDNADELTPFFGKAQKIGEVENPLAVEKGTSIYLYTDPKPAL